MRKKTVLTKEKEMKPDYRVLYQSADGPCPTNLPPRAKTKETQDA